MSKSVGTKIIDALTGRVIVEKVQTAIEKKVEKTVDKFLKSRPSSVSHFMKKYPKAKIREFRVCRKPIQSQYTKLLNVWTKGNVQRVKKKYDYDDIFHLYGFLIMDNGKKFYIEKNEIVIMKEYQGRIPEEDLDCEIRRDFTPMNIVEFIKKAEKTYANLYLYSATHDNCQRFMRHMARTLGITGLDDFIMQYNAGEILQGSVKENAKKITSIGNVFSRLLGFVKDDFVIKAEKPKKKKRGTVVRQKDRRKNLKKQEKIVQDRKQKQKERKAEILEERKARKGR